MVFFNSIGNCYCRKNMSTCATACNDEAKRPPRPSKGGSCVVTLIWFCVAQYFCLQGWGVLLFCCFVLVTLVTLVTEVATSLLTTHHVELTIH